MRIFGLIGLVLVLVIVLVLAARQLTVQPNMTTNLTKDLPSPMHPSDPATAPRTITEQAQFIEQQVKDAVQNAQLQPLRNAPADAQ
jgi:hypothetical protein